MNPKQILVVQNLGEMSFYDFISKIARVLGLKRGSDFMVVSDGSQIEREVFENNQPQLLIIDNVNINSDDPDNTLELYRLIGALRAKNPKLIIVGYSNLSHDPMYFNYVISKSHPSSKGRLKKLINHFRAGDLQPN